MSILKFLLGFIIFIILALVILFYETIKRMKIFRTNVEKAAERAARKAAKEEEYFRRTSNKYYHKEETANFSKDYFKSCDKGKDEKQQQDSEKKTARQTTSSEGVTIIDERDDRKIFNNDEGEYVEFEEV